jgi:hypothetical protein
MRVSSHLIGGYSGGEKKKNTLFELEKCIFSKRVLAKFTRQPY